MKNFREWIKTNIFLESENKNLEDLDSELYNILINKYSKDIFNHNFWENEFVPKLISYFEKYGFKVGGEGRNRIGLVSDKRNIIIKIPKNSYGDSDNNYEYNNQHNKNFFGNLAKNKIYIFKKLGISILIMEKIDTSMSYKELPDWAKCVDCGQVGKNKRGIFKAYDYGFN